MALMRAALLRARAPRDGPRAAAAGPLAGPIWRGLAGGVLIVCTASKFWSATLSRLYFVK